MAKFALVCIRLASSKAAMMKSLANIHEFLSSNASTFCYFAVPMHTDARKGSEDRKTFYSKQVEATRTDLQNSPHPQSSSHRD